VQKEGNQKRTAELITFLHLNMDEKKKTLLDEKKKGPNLNVGF
jgi:hypothetical protein